jgi:hypothetical protein
MEEEKEIALRFFNISNDLLAVFLKVTVCPLRLLNSPRANILLMKFRGKLTSGKFEDLYFFFTWMYLYKIITNKHLFNVYFVIYLFYFSSQIHL